MIEDVGLETNQRSTAALNGVDIECVHMNSRPSEGGLKNGMESIEGQVWGKGEKSIDRRVFRVHEMD